MAIYNISDSVACLFTSVTNTSGGELYFGFLPPHGRRLAANDQIYFFGDIQDWINRYATNYKVRQAIETAISNGDLRIDHTPAVVVSDGPGDSGKYHKQIVLEGNGCLATADELCWVSVTPVVECSPSPPG